jgi:polyhydroxyalkanoate synthesis regulator protein
MAISNNLLLNNLSGQVGRQIVFKQYGNKTVVSKYPDMSKRKFSSRQKQLQNTMAEANYDIRTVLGDKKLRMEAQLRLNVTSNRLYTALIKEYFANVWPTVEAPMEKKAKARRKSR